MKLLEREAWDEKYQVMYSQGLEKLSFFFSVMYSIDKLQGIGDVSMLLFKGAGLFLQACLAMVDISEQKGEIGMYENELIQQSFELIAQNREEMQFRMDDAMETISLKANGMSSS